MLTTRLAAIPVLLVLAAAAACNKGPANVAAAPGQAPSAPPLAQAPVRSSEPTATGTVAETMNAGGYTYVRLDTGKGDLWFAATEFPVKVGERLTVPLEAPMQNFQSKTLNRTFPEIYFVSQVAREGQALQPAAEQPPLQEPAGGHAAAPVRAAPIERIAPPPGGLSIADVWTRRTALANKTVVIRGKVVKVNNGIMGKNWVHLQDGSGSAADGTNDLAVTTAATLTVGEVVTMSGVLGTGKDFGAGYAYEAILEQATASGR